MHSFNNCLKRVIFIFSIVSIQLNLTAQTCLSGTTWLTQADINNFSTNYPGCTHVLGELRIENSVTSLAGLSQITKMDDYIDIRFNNNLTSLDGLENIDTIGGVYLSNNFSLSNIDAFTSLKYIQDAFTISGNNEIISVSGFNNVEYIGDQLTFVGNDKLTSVTGFTNLVDLEGRLDIRSNDVLDNVSGLHNLETIGGNVQISNNISINAYNDFPSLREIGGALYLFGNPNISEFNGFGALEKVGGAIAIKDYPMMDSINEFSAIDSCAGITLFNMSSLTSMNGLREIEFASYLYLDLLPMITHLDDFYNLVTCHGYIHINNCANLSNINGLINIDSTGYNSLYPNYTDLVITNNPNLSNCNIRSICNILDIDNLTTSISGNATNCNSRTEIESLCCPGTLTIDWSPFLDGTYEASGDIIVKSPIEPNRNIILSHGPNGKIIFDGAVSAGTSANLTLKEEGCN